MRITELLKKESIALQAAPKTKEEAINTLVDLMEVSGNLLDRDAYLEGVLARESLSTTGIGEGIAIPHAKNKGVKKAGLSAMVAPAGVDYQALDGENSNLFFMIAAPDNGADEHLEVLSRLSTLLMDADFRSRLLKAETKEEFLKAIDEQENKKFAEEAQEKPNPKEGYRVLAVTACPTGIAHTFMAAESLEQKAAEKGISIKVETNGSGGVKNRLSAKEIEEAECIIVAADKKVEMARFDGKRVIQTKVANGINKAEKLLEEAISGQVPIYHSDGKQEENNGGDEGKVSTGRQIYMHLMNGVSHMLPFVIGGGILIALAFLFDDYSINPANFGSNLPFAAFLKQVGDAAFGFMLPILAGFIAMSIADRPALAVGFVGGYLAKEGGSGFLGALLAGFVAGYLMIALRKIFSKLPASLEGIKPVLLYPFFGILLIGAMIQFLINPPVSMINTALFSALNSMGSGSKVLLGIVLGAMMAIDMGGPLNKAAYVFGTASIESGQYDIMAAVMIGGMIPPLAIALCTTFFKNRFTKKERQSGIVNYVMGLSFITEGAIPFAAADPIRVIPACAIGAGIAGGLSMYFQCTLRAPHGGIFVTPVIGHPLNFLLAVVIGAVVGMLLLALLRKPIQE